ncbi:MAG: curli assembly protein CsgF [Negativicutes bacterium]|nr:curli assembly protein CsgF [Negativicutes bacterium]
MHRFPQAFTTLALLCGLTATAVQASELVYTPINPSFGGNPLNGPTLLNEAQAQNHFTEKTPDTSSQQDPLTQFNSMLKSAILSRVSSAVTSSIVGTNGQLTPGTVDTTDFRISITNIPGGLLQIVTTDKATGQSTQFQVNQVNQP